jgi:hypothetical protein
MAQEFGDHPDAAAERMRWVRQFDPVSQSDGHHAYQAKDVGR